MLTWSVSATYWLSQFTVMGLALLCVYLRRNESFTRFRNAIMLANVLGPRRLRLLPTAPPRMFPELGFVDTLSTFGGLNHGSGLIEFASNPYAAMPSLHSADALIVGVVMATVVRRSWAKAIWLAWPAWVWFAVIATGNHFWLDVVAGVRSPSWRARSSTAGSCAQRCASGTNLRAWLAARPSAASRTATRPARVGSQPGRWDGSRAPA